MINDFIDNVVSYGVVQILPHNLEEKWLKLISDASAEFLRITAQEEKTDPETFLNHEKGMLLMAAVNELIQHRYDYPAHFQISTLPKEVLYDLVSCYSIAILMEEAKRFENISIPEFNEDNILEKDEIEKVEISNPDISRFLFKKIS